MSDRFTTADLKAMGLVEKNGVFVKETKFRTMKMKAQDGTINTVSYVPLPILDGFFDGVLKIYPKPTTRPRVNTKTGHAYNVPAYTAYKKALVILIEELKIHKRDWQRIEATFFYGFTKGMKVSERYEGKPRRVRPDSDNLGKALLDALEQAHVIKDDAKIWSMKFDKRYTFGEPNIQFKLML